MSSASPDSLLKQVVFFPFIAPPNGGKGTQTAILSEQFDMPRVDMGAMLREIGKEESELGRAIRERTSAGLLVDTTIVVNVLKEGISRQILARANNGSLKNPQGFILDGFPRNQEQTEGLMNLCQGTGAQIGMAFYLDVPDAVIVERAANRRICPNCGAIYNLKTKAPKVENVCDACGHAPEHRVDDHPEKVQVRLDGFAKETLPILAALEDAGKLARVDGNRVPSEVTADLTQLIQQQLKTTVAV